MRSLFTIGTLARRGGVRVSTIRHYERMGLLAAECRTAGNFRLYGEDSIAVLQFVRRAKSQGLRLKDTQAVLRCAALAGRSRSGRARRRALRNLARRVEWIDSQISRLRYARRVLRKSSAIVRAERGNFHRILASLVRGG